MQNEEWQTYWICQDCYIMLHHGEAPEGSDGPDVLLKEFEIWGIRVTDGIMSEAHSEHCEGGECDCTYTTYSTSSCDGCGTFTHGERHAVTGWQQKVDPFTYKVVRHFRDSGRKRVIKTGLTLKEAQEHCNDPETSSSTCTTKEGKRRTYRSGPWFDGYTQEN